MGLTPGRVQFAVVVLLLTGICHADRAADSNNLQFRSIHIVPQQELAIPGPHAPLPDHLLASDADAKSVTVTNGVTETHFTFYLTNISSQPITIFSADPSCTCTSVELPEQPWKLPPGSNGAIRATMNVVNRLGSLEKTITVSTDHGVKRLFVKSTILPTSTPIVIPASAADRQGNQKLALADRQAVFKGNCAQCHVAPAREKWGGELYQTACAICHEAEHRASMVPDLHAIPQETNAEFWRTWIRNGKPGTLMPAFAREQGGILSEPQIASLVDYLLTAIPSKSLVAPADTKQSKAH